ncbi:AAA ATPase [Mycobacteroides abscessus subsp. abscessus]|uniref:type VII secretion AAA-ATPase EccA n=1 Tax=Mycobacteroides abscessus TaxID=36809 RepID=UPI00092A3611|nr:type VII secretion AAA-ATPase EccA [Mycobacteroides abscessus]SHU26632.1 AAA ATPase [Mycobacteroides abscessus subsp. abscessus]
MTVVDHQQLADRYDAAAATTANDQRLQRFIAITDDDASACDAWVGRIACGDVDRITMFRAWNSRYNFGRLASAVDRSVVALNARLPIGCGYVNGLTIPVRSARELSLGYALDLAAEENFDDALEVLQEVPADGTSTWVTACVLSLGHRWDSVNDTINEFDWTADPTGAIYIPCAELLRGVASAHLGLWAEAERRLLKANENHDIAGYIAHTVSWYLAMIYRETDRADEATVHLQFLEANYPSAKVTEAISNPQFRLEVTTREQISSRTDVWDAASAAEISTADDQEREQALRDAQARLDEVIGLVKVKDQVGDVWATAEMTSVRGEMGKKTSTKTRHLVFAGPPGTKKTSIGDVIRDIYFGLKIIKKRKLIYALGKDLIGTHVGQTAPKTNAVIDSALDGILFIDEAYSIVRGSKEAAVFGLEAVDTLLARMENDRDRLIVIVAGYRTELDVFLDSNQGLRGRFSRTIVFPGYNADEIVEIAKFIAKQGDSRILPEAATELWGAATYLANTTTLSGKRALDVAGNGRYSRTVVEAGETARDRRVNEFRKKQPPGTPLSDELVETITVDDMRVAIELAKDNVFGSQAPEEGGHAAPAIIMTEAQLAAAHAKLAEFGCQQPDLALQQALDAGGFELV